jgi:hypothetical protein
MVRLRLAAAAAFLMFRFAAARRVDVAMLNSQLPTGLWTVDNWE